jgi:hypothetical protein
MADKIFKTGVELVTSEGKEMWHFSKRKCLQDTLFIKEALYVQNPIKHILINNFLLLY